ncbi:AI-2E family transporter [Antarcticirhabdus aurantiaca]|uniref:AI-2E family transporter n=1 Tax=Antarcticirhabdus aurantiaca TaxID=2606717 RepID=A0ACD4NLJ6_9HYPH|nr:AI-2E family transporter [Antarcticirhabdus aurantiaca]WAJ27679.1 AI-2E family transporter [Jeongeuplla avenae]
MDLIASQMLKKAMPLFTALAATLLVLAISAILTLGQEIFVPFALGILLSFILAPIVTFLQRWRVPRILAVSVAVLFATLTILGILAVVAAQLGSLAGDLPQYRRTIQDKLEAFTAAETDSQGPLARAREAIQGMVSDIQHLGDESPAAAAAGGDDAQPDAEPAEPRPIPVTIASNAGALDTAYAVISPLLSPLATFGIVVVFAIFILIQASDLRNRFIRLVGTDDLQQTTAAIDDAARRVSRLLLFQSGVNALFAILVGGGLYLIGVPSPFLWGILAGILRFIPYIGGFIGAGLPMALAFAVDPGWSMIIWTAALFLIIETALSNIVEPVVYGHSTGMSPVAILLAAVIWTFLWGPVGLVLATPLTICLVVMGRHVPRLGFIDVMFGDRPALLPQQIFYQRMLVGAYDEAADQAREFLRRRPLVTYYDEVALEGMRLGHEDVARFAVKDGRLETLRDSTLALVGRLEREAPLPRGGRVSAEAAAAIDAAGPERPAVPVLTAKGELSADWQASVPVVCVSGTSALDAPVTAMLAQVLTKHGLAARHVTLAELRENRPGRAEADGVALVCLSFLEPLSTVHLRQMVREVHRVAPDAHVLIGIWRQRDESLVQDLNRKVRADGLVTTLTAALARAVEMATPGPADVPAGAEGQKDAPDPAALTKVEAAAA